MKLFNFMGISALSALMLPMLISCSDEPNGGDNADKNVIEFDGTRLTSIDSYNVKYDGDGRVSTISYGNSNELEFDYSKGVIYLDYEEANVKFNGDGYITEISQSWDFKETGYEDKGSGKLKFSYKDGRLTKIESNASGTEKEDGETYKWEEKYTSNLTWKNGNLTEISSKGSEIEDGDKDDWSEDYSISYGTQLNEFNQYCFTVAEDVIMGGSEAMLVCVGLFGDGPSMLPTSITSDYDRHSYTTSLSFTLNSNGSIKTEKVDNNTLSYGYSNYYTKADTGLANEGAKLSIRNMFVKKHVRK